MGLLMGASVLSVCEIFDLFVYNSIRKCCKVRVHPVQPPEEVKAPSPEMMVDRSETFVTELEDEKDNDSIRTEIAEDWML